MRARSFSGSTHQFQPDKALGQRLKILVPRLPEHEGELSREILEGDDLLFREVSVVIVDLHQHGLA